MNTVSMDEDVIPELSEENNEAYVETCEHEVNSILPRLQRLSISDDEVVDMPFDNKDMPCFSMDINSTNDFMGDLTKDSNEKVSSMFVSNASGNICANEGSKAAAESEMSPHRILEKQHIFSTNKQSDIQFQEVLQEVSTKRDIAMFSMNQKEEQVLDEKVSEEGPLDLSVKNMDYIKEAESNSSVSENKARFQSLMAAPDEIKRKDSETGELLETINIIHAENPSLDGVSDTLEKCANEKDYGIMLDSDASKQSCSTDISSDEQSRRSSGIIIDLSPCSEDTEGVTTTSFEDESPRKISQFIPPISRMSEIRQRCFSISASQPPNKVTAKTEKNNSSSDEDSKRPPLIRKGSPRNSKRRCKKAVKFSPISKTLNSSDHQNDEEKGPSPCKQKKESPETLTETVGKFRKRSLSEQDSLTNCEKSLSIIRSRSLSPGSEISSCTSGNDSPIEISIVPQSRKRTCTESIIVGHVKCRKPNLSDDVKNS